MTYRLGKVVDRKSENYRYYHGHLIKPKKRLPKVLFILILVVALPCAGIWIANSNFSVQPEQVSAEADQTPVSVIAPEAEPLPQTGPGSETNPEVQRFLHEWLKAHGKDKWSVYVEQLGTNRQVASVNADRQFELASLYKLFIPSVLAGTVPVQNWSRIQTSDTEPRTIERCVRDMLRSSDNACGEALAARIGWNNLDKKARESGYVFTNLNSTDYLKGTARDTASLLKDLYNGNGFDANVKQQMLTAMHEQRLNKGIPAGCEGCVVYSKTGDMNGSRHDSAIIEYGGKTYVLVIMSKGGSYKQIAELTKGILDKFKLGANSVTTPAN